MTPAGGVAMSNEELAIQKKNGNADQLPALFAQVEAFVNMKAEQAGVGGADEKLDKAEAARRK